MLYEWCAHFGAQILHVVALNGCELRDLPTGQIARGLLGRPDVDPGGRTYVEIAKPIIGCDTKSYEDLHKIFKGTVQHASDAILRLKSQQPDDELSPEASAEDAIILDGGDGQTFNLMEGGAKKLSYLWSP